jgi:putative intracellular protease/amidase
MWDLVDDPISKALTTEFFSTGKIIAAVCHGPAALLNVKLESGEYLLQDQAVTGFSNVEEDTAGLSSVMPFQLETELSKRSGGHYKKATEPWGEKVAIGHRGRLITGQNPASAGPLGEAIKKALKL